MPATDGSPVAQRSGEEDWDRIAAFRNVVVHDYLGLDLELIWDILEDDLPKLKRIIGELPEAPR